MNRIVAAVAASLLFAGSLACNKSEDKPAEQPGAKASSSDTTKVNAFAVDISNLNVDTISVRRGNANPDGNRDLVFTGTVEGPADALFIATTDDKGSPLADFRADTVPKGEELPQELAAAGPVDTGGMTVWMAVVENGKFVNDEKGRVKLAPGPHALKMYVPNTNTLRPNSHVRLYARAPGGAIVGGPIVPY